MPISIGEAINISRRLVTVTQACRIANVSKPTIEKRIKDGKLTVYGPGVRKIDVDQLLTTTTAQKKRGRPKSKPAVQQRHWWDARD